MMMVSCEDDAAAQFEASIARKIIKYCISVGKCLDFAKGFDDFLNGKPGQHLKF
jgi:hypothetical protein